MFGKDQDQGREIYYTLAGLYHYYFGQHIILYGTQTAVQMHVTVVSYVDQDSTYYAFRRRSRVVQHSAEMRRFFMFLVYKDEVVELDHCCSLLIEATNHLRLLAQKVHTNP